MAVPLDEPGSCCAVDEAGHGLAELIDGVVQLDPRHRSLEVRIQRSAQPLVSAPRNAGLSAILSQASEPVKWAGAVLVPSRGEVPDPRVMSPPVLPRSVTAS